jgi:Lipase (class 3)
MITDQTLAQLCAATYDPASVWDTVWTSDDVHVCHKVIDGVDIIACRGSVLKAEDGSFSLTDWLRDLDAVPIKHPLLGWVHAGFVKYMDLVFENVLDVVGRDVIITGHSLGAARASDLTGLFLAHGCRVMARVTFGEPRPGFKRLAQIISDSGCVSRSYRNGIDPVPEVPVPFWPLLPYVHITEPLPFSLAPSEPIDPRMWHNTKLYATGVPTTPIEGAPK